MAEDGEEQPQLVSEWLCSFGKKFVLVDRMRQELCLCRGGQALLMRRESRMDRFDVYFMSVTCAALQTQA